MSDPQDKSKHPKSSKTYKGDGYKHTIVDDEHGRTHYIDLSKTKQDRENDRITEHGARFRELTERVESAADSKGDISGRDLLALLDKLGLGSHISKEERARVAKHTFHIKDTYENLEKEGMGNFVAALKEFENKAWEASGQSISGLDPSRRHKLTPALIKGLSKVAMAQHLNSDDKNFDPYSAIKSLLSMNAEFDQLLDGQRFNGNLQARDAGPEDVTSQQSNRAVAPVKDTTQRS